MIGHEAQGAQFILMTMHRSLAILLLGLPCAAVAADHAPILPSVGSRSYQTDDQRLAGIPDDAALEASGARIGQIKIRNLELFDVGGRDQDSVLFRWGNRLHVNTRDATITDQLLFREGDLYNASAIAESARILRSRRYLRDAFIRPVAYQEGLVDLEVTTQDVWSFNPGLSFSRSGGRNSTGFELEELNLFGLGSRLGIGFKSDADRDSKAIKFRDPQLGSSWWDLLTEYSDNSDGRLAELSLIRPFYSLDSRWAAGIALSDDLRVDSRYDLGEKIDQYETHARVASAHWGFSKGLVGGWARRYSFGATYDDREFADAPGLAPSSLLPGNRRLMYPWVAAEWVQDRFAIARNRDQIDKIEDYSLGWNLRAQLGYASTGFGSDRNAFILKGSASTGYELTTRQSILLSAEANGRMEEGRLANGLLGAEARYYFKQSSQRLLFMGLSATAGSNLDPDTQILLGGDSGLRGYPLRYRSGTGRWMFTAEQRMFSNWFPFQLFNVGGAVFFDMGESFGRRPLATEPQGVLKDAGFGLRLGNGRSGLGNLVHIDFAFPLDGDSSIRGMQVVVETKQRF